MTDDNKTFEPVDLQAGTPAPDIKVTPPAPATPETPTPEASAEPEVQAPEIVKPTDAPAEGGSQPASAVLDGEPEGQKTADDGFFKKNKTMIMGGVVGLIVITVIVGIVLSIGNSDKLEGRLELLQQNAATEAVQTDAPATIEEELPVPEPTNAPTVSPKVIPTTSRANPEPDTKNYPNIVSLYAVK